MEAQAGQDDRQGISGDNAVPPTPPEVGKITPSTFDPFDLGGGGAWGAETNMSHPDLS